MLYSNDPKNPTQGSKLHKRNLTALTSTYTKMNLRKYYAIPIPIYFLGHSSMPFFLYILYSVIKTNGVCTEYWTLCTPYIFSSCRCKWQKSRQSAPVFELKHLLCTMHKLKTYFIDKFDWCIHEKTSAFFRIFVLEYL